MISLNTNLAALDTALYLNRHNQRAQNSLEHLSSGLRIMKAADDPGYIGISVKLRVDAMAFQQSARNASEGIEVIQIADSAAADIVDIMNKIRVFSLQAANGTVDSAGRTGLSAAFTNLKSEIQRVMNTTRYSDIVLLKTTNSAGGSGSTGALTTSLTLAGVKFALGPSADQMMPVNFINGVSSIENSMRVSGGTSNLLYGTLSSVSAAKSVITSVDAAIRSLSFFRGALGGTQDALGVSSKADENMGFNVTAALSQVRDLDFASEVANFTQASILQQAATAFLAQANLLNQSVLQLLG
ncbi:MAG: hypothetical protein HYT87_02560 [Nitrospirae bacterium]|nr:hypothetical protein [Nitrospirota bacterium]